MTSSNSKIHIEINNGSFTFESTSEEEKPQIISIFNKTDFQSPTLKNKYLKFKTLIEELKQRTLPESIINHINVEINIINEVIEQNESILGERIEKGKGEILNLLKRELHIFPRHYYRYRWPLFGIFRFDLPVGILFFLFYQNGYHFIIGCFVAFILTVLFGRMNDQAVANDNRQLKYKDWDFSTAGKK